MSTAVVRRVYEEIEDEGVLVLVDRVWPRGISKARMEGVRWLKDVAPSNELRRWYGHDPERFPEFRRRYLEELEGSEALQQLRSLGRRLVLLTATKDVEHSQAAVLAELLGDSSSK